MKNHLQNVDVMRVTLNREGLAVNTLRKKHLATIKRKLKGYSLTETSPRKLEFEIDDFRISVDNNRINAIGRPRIDTILRHAEEVLKALDSKMVGGVSLGFAMYNEIASVERFESALLLIFPEGKAAKIEAIGGDREIHFETDLGMRRLQIDLAWDKPEARGRLWVLYDCFFAKPIETETFRKMIEDEHAAYLTLTKTVLGTYDLQKLVSI